MKKTKIKYSSVLTKGFLSDFHKHTYCSYDIGFSAELQYAP